MTRNDRYSIAALAYQLVVPPLVAAEEEDVRAEPERVICIR